MIDEFKHWFKISFSYRGKDFKETSPVKEVDTNNENWFYGIELNVDNENLNADVFGTILENGELTTSYAFGVDVYVDDDTTDTIDDVDIIDGE